MAEYIKREYAVDAVLDVYYDTPDIDLSGEKFEDAILKIPAADVAPVRHGRWVSVPHKLARVCSVCNRDEPYKFADIDADVYDYCPNCGAKMDGGAGNGC